LVAQASGLCAAEPAAPPDWIGAGYYDDEYAKMGGEWKFRSRTVAMYYMTPLSEGWAERAAKRG
jgi:hypothetical protein